MSAKNYLIRTLLFAFMVSLTVAGLNYAVNPYVITGVPRIAHVSEYKVGINDHISLMKKYQPLFTPYNALIAGNSRVELGINPSHHCFHDIGMDVYNLGIPGAEVRTQIAYVLNLIYQQPIQEIFLSVDFTDFISSEVHGPRARSSMLKLSRGELKYTASGERNPDYLSVVLLDYYKALFSLDALIATIRTVALQSKYSPDRDDAGFNPARDFHNAVRVEGPRALFDQKMFALRKKYSRPWFLRDVEGRLNSSVEDLHAFLGITSSRGIKVHLFTNPFHESYWELLREQGLMPLYAQWMSSMEELAENHRGGLVTFWDFSGDTPYIHEVIPDKGVKTGPLQWFWEPAHYRQQLGDLMINAMLSERCDAEVKFGQKVF